MCGESGLWGNQTPSLEVAHPLHVITTPIALEETLTHYSTKGTPPHMWGIFKFSRSSSVTLWEHPHMCGEYLFWANPLFPAQETPPHVWGIHRKRVAPGYNDGNTPTCVGNT